MEDCSLSESSWNQLIDDVLAQEGIKPYSDPHFSESGSGTAAKIWSPGSTRGVTILRGAHGNVDLRFIALASRQDWQTGFALAREALARGNGRLMHENGEQYTVANLTAEQAIEDAITDFVETVTRVIALLESEGTDQMPLPFDYFTLDCKTEDFAGCTYENMPAFEERLAMRVGKYASAYHADVLMVEERIRVASWTLLPTIIGKVDYVVVDCKEKLTLPRDRLLEILGDRAERLGVATYLPELDASRNFNILMQLENARIPMEDMVPTTSVLENLGDDASETLAETTAAIVYLLVSQQELDDMRQSMMQDGFDEVQADALIAAVRLALEAIFEKNLGPDRVYQALLDADLPPDTARAIVAGVGQALQDMQQARAGAGRSCLGMLLLPIAIAILWILW
ncbi:MAG: hypothetical protein QGF67_15075 [Lentisphaeria bacterium]|nr:hypothetical protein [Lentisphaeria bacterium]